MSNSEIWMIIFLSGLFLYGILWTFTHSTTGISLMAKISKKLRST